MVNERPREKPDRTHIVDAIDRKGISISKTASEGKVARLRVTSAWNSRTGFGRELVEDDRQGVLVS